MTDGPQSVSTPEPSRPAGGAPARTGTPRAGTPRPKPAAPRSPNYAARRMLVTTIGITAVVAVAVFGRRTIRGDTTTTASEDVSWNQVVLIDRSTGSATAIDPDDPTKAAGQVASTARAVAVHVEGRRLAVVQNDQITLSDLDGTAPVVVPIDNGAVVERLPVPDALWLAVGSESGGNIVLVDGLIGTTYDVGALVAPTQIRVFLETLRHDDTGRVFAMADALNFQSIVVHTDTDPPTADFFADQPIAVGPDRLVTSEVVGQQADLALVDPERKELAKVSGELPAGGVLADGQVTVVTTEGTMLRFGEGDTEAERLGTVAVPAGAAIRFVQPTADGTRFVVFGDTFEAVVDLDGRTVYTTTFAAAVDPPVIDPGWRCVPIGGGDAWVALVDMESGDITADLLGFTVTGTSADGCALIGTRSGLTEVVTADGAAQIGQTRAAALAPDGEAVVVQTTAGVTQLIEIDGTSIGDPVDLSSLAPTNLLVAFRED